MRTNQGSSNDLLYRSNQTRRDTDPYAPNSPNALKEQTEYITREKYNKLKDLNSKLKAALRDYMQEGKDQEKILQLKEEIIQKYERERSDWQHKGNEDLKSQLNQLKIKVQKKKTKMRLLKDQSKVFDARLDQQKASFQVELDRVQRLYDALTTEIKDHEKRYKLLKDENNVIKQAVVVKEEQSRYLEIELKEDKQKIQILESKINEQFEENRILQLTIDNLTNKNQDLEKLIKINEANHQQESNKLQSDKLSYSYYNVTAFIFGKYSIFNYNSIKQIYSKCHSLQQQELNSQINKKKDKIKAMNNQIQQLENTVNQKQQQEFKLNNLVQEKQKEYLKLQAQLEDQKNKIDQVSKEANYYLSDIKQLKSELEQQKSLVKTNEDKLAEYDKQYQLDQEEKNQILQDLEQLKQENRRIQQLLYEFDNDISYLNQQHLERQRSIEKTVEYLQNQLKHSQENLAESKSLLLEMQKQQATNEEQIEFYKNKYQKSKQNRKRLQNEQRCLEERIKMIEYDRIQDEREVLRNKDNIIQQKQVQQSKIRVLDDIQNMIKLHKRTNF